jgi:tetratricopeptide (TPR) repeat protein
MLHAIVAIALLAATPPPGGPWYEHYERGVRLISQGQASAALPELQSAASIRSKEGLQVPTRPQQYLDYLPHLYLAIANQMTGDLEAAKKELALAETSGIAARSEVGRPLLVAYQLLLRGSPAEKNYATYTPKPPLLSDQEFNMLRRDVLSRCDLPANMKSSDAPWYANYELGVELERKGDYPRALTHFIDAVARRPNPQRHARMYGMWLVDYYPYFHIARSHVQLKNWECAKNALDISQKLGEIPADSPEMSELLSLQRETERRLSEK